MTTRCGAVLLTGVVACAAAVPLVTAAADNFFAGKTITVVVGSSAGGGIDMNGRLLARHLGKHIPGNPDLIVQNMPGAASLNAVRYLDANAPKDGTVIVDFNFGLITESKINPNKIKVDFTKVSWLGSISQDVSVCFVRRIPAIGNLGDAQRYSKELNFGLSAGGSSSDISAHITKNIFKVPMRQVAGYPGNAEQRIALERGELDGACNVWSATPSEWIAKGSIVTLLKFSPASGPDLPADVPYAVDIAPTPQAAEVIKLLTMATTLARSFILSSQVPTDRLQVLRRAFDATMTDPAFLAEAARQRQPVQPTIGEDCLTIVQEIYALRESVVAAAKHVATE